MPVSFVPFNALVPDGGDYGAGLTQADNVLPIHGGFRTVNKIVPVASVADGPVTRAYVHMYMQAQAIQFLRPDADTSVGAWLTSTGSSCYSLVNEAEANDAGFIYAVAPAAAPITLALSDPAAAVLASNHYIRWRYNIPNTPSAAWTMKVELMEGANVRATDTATGAAATSGFVQREYTLSAPEIAAITAYTDLRLRFTATVPGSAQFCRPGADNSVGSWLTNSGGSTNLYQTIDEAAVDDADYITTPILVPNAAALTYVANLSSGVDPVTNDGFTWRYRYRATQAGVTIVATLLQGSTTIKTVTHTNAATSLTTNTVALSAGEAGAITDFAALRFSVAASLPSEPTPTAFQYARPDGIGSNTGWSASATTLNGDIDESSPDDVDFIIAGLPSLGSVCVLSLGNVTDPGLSGGHVLRVRARRSVFNAGNLLVTLKENTTAIAPQWDISGSGISGSWQTFTLTLTAAQADAITDYSDLWVEFVGDDSVYVSWCEFQVPEPAKAVVTWQEVELPSASRGEVSWGELQVPDGSTSYLGDVPTIFAGTKTKLYTVAQAGFTDISKGGGYAGGASYPSSWSFCSFGNDVIATNYIDPVQYRAGNTGNFADLITSTLKPKARFVAAIRNQVILGGINLSAHYDDEVWWSAVDNARDFDRSARTQCDWQRLVSTPGQIMGLVGGDFGIVFKRNAIHALDWNGGQIVFRVRDVSASIGTPFPQSIVTVSGTTYFWAYNSFYRTNGYDAPEPVGSAVLSRFLSDTAFSTGAIDQIQPTSLTQEDQVMIGWYDQHAGLIFWVYQRPDTSDPEVAIKGYLPYYRHHRAVVYNPSEDKWTCLKITGADIAQCVNKPNVTNADTFLLKGTVGFSWDQTNTAWFRFSGASTYGATLKTKIQNIAIDQNDRPLEVKIRGVLPVFDVASSPKVWPTMTLTVLSGNDPRLSVNTVTETYNTTQANEWQWMPHHNAGQWFQFTLSCPEMTDNVAIAFKGLYVDYEFRGRP